MIENDKLAKPSHRVLAMGIDVVVLIFLQFIYGALTVWLYEWFCSQLGFPALTDLKDWINQLTGLFLFFGYYTVSVGLFGNSVGKHILNIQTLSDDGSPLSLKQAYIRSVSYLLSSWTYFVGFLMPFFREDRKALHDLVCRTLVVDLEKYSTTQVSSQMEFNFNNKTPAPQPQPEEFKQAS